MKKYIMLFCVCIILCACGTNQQEENPVATDDSKAVYQPENIDLERALRYTTNDYLNAVLASYVNDEDAEVEILIAWKDMEDTYNCYALVNGQTMYELSVTKDNVVSIQEKNYQDYLTMQEDAGF